MNSTMRRPPFRPPQPPNHGPFPRRPTPFDFRQRPPYPPRPLTKPKRQPVTIAVGILPLQEKTIVLATDTRYESQLVSYGEKVFPLPPRDRFRVVVAAAGLDADLMKIAALDIERALPQTPLAMDRLCSLIEERTTQFYRIHVLPLVKAKVPDTPDYAFLIAVWCEPDQLRLLKYLRGASSTVDKYDFIGTGAAVAHSYAHLEGSRVTDFESGMLAAYWVAQAKLYDPYCGGETKLYSLDAAGGLKEFDPLYVQLAESHFKALSSLFDSILIPASVGDDDMLADVLDENLRGEVSEIKRCRRSLIQMYDHRAWRVIWPPSPI